MKTDIENRVHIEWHHANPTVSPCPWQALEKAKKEGGEVREGTK